MRVLDLFSGSGGFAIAAEMAGGFETVAFCEADPACRRVLARHWPGVPIHDDVRNLRGEQVGAVDVVCGGFPCQPFSVAGKRRGSEDDRHLWPEMLRVIEETRPAWVLGENVTGLIGLALDGVLADLEAAGYASRTFVVPACAVDAPHRRDRVWIVAYAGHDAGRAEGDGWDWQCGCVMGNPHVARQQQPQGCGAEQRRRDCHSGGAVGHTDRKGPQEHPRQRGDTRPQQPAAVGAGWCGSEWLACSDGKTRRVPGPQPGLRGMADGIPAGVDADGRIPLTVPSREIPNRAARIRMMGNAIVPGVAAMFFRAIREAAA